MALALVILLNLLASFYFFRIDLTRREDDIPFSLKPKALLKTLDDVVFVEVFLEGEDLNPEFRRFQKSVRETLEEFRIHSNNRIQYTFTNPLQALNEKARNEYIAELNSKGISPRNVIETRDGQRVEKFVFPGALISYEGFEAGVMLLKGNRAQSINQSS
jgi:ABC-2 type transport system permease protein